MKQLFIAFGLLAGLAVLIVRFAQWETKVDYGYQPPPTPEQRQAYTGEGDESLKATAPQLFE